MDLMLNFDGLVLLLTGLLAIFMIYQFLTWQKKEETSGVWNIYYSVGFLVLLVAGLLLIIFGWGALANNFVAVVGGLIPFSLATGLISRFYPKYEKMYLILMVIGLVLITVTRYGNMLSLGKIVYPVFHAIAGLTIFFIPILVCKGKKVQKGFGMVTIGGTLIGLGGIALAFLKAGKQLLFFSQDFVIMILAPLLFFMTLFFALGFMKGKNK